MTTVYLRGITPVVVEKTSTATTDTYIVTGDAIQTLTLVFPIGTSIEYVYRIANNAVDIAQSKLTLQDIILDNLAMFSQEVTNFVTSKYSLETRVNFIAMHIYAINNGLTNRKTYLEGLLDWQNQVYAYASSRIQIVSSLTNTQDVLQYTWNFDNLILNDPKLDQFTALSIMN